MNNVFLEVINSVNLVNKKMNDNMKSLFSKYIKLLAVLLLSVAGVGQAWGDEYLLANFNIPLKAGMSGASTGIAKIVSNNLVADANATVTTAPGTTSLYYNQSTLAGLATKANWSTGSSSSRTVRGLKFSKGSTYTIKLSGLTATKVTFYGYSGNDGKGTLTVGSGSYTNTLSKDFANWGVHEFNINNTGSISISATDADMYGVLVITASAGSSCSDATPTISASPNKTVICSAGSPTSLTLTADAYEAGATLQWYKDGVSLTGQTSATLAVSAAGSYVVKATKACEKASDAYVVTQQTPTITGGTSVAVGGTLTLTGSNTGASWTSSNTSVATVSDGTVSGVSGGAATITYTTTDGCTATKEVTVSAAYNVTATVSGSNGTVSTGAAKLAAGSTTTITAVPASGYRVASWAVSGTGASISPSGSSHSTTTTLTMGTADATVTVTFEAIPTHTVTAATATGDNSEGTASVTPSTVGEGGTATVTATPASGYVFDHWVVTGAGSSVSSATSATATLTMGTANTTVTAHFRAAGDCEYRVIAEAVLNGKSSASTLTGGTLSVSGLTESSAPFKLGSKPSYFGMTLNENLQAGDSIIFKVKIGDWWNGANVDELPVVVFSGENTSNEIYRTSDVAKLTDNYFVRFVVTQAMIDSKGLTNRVIIWREKNNSSGDITQNHSVYSMQVKRCEEPCSTPAAPTAVAVGNIASSSAMLTITDPGDAASYDIYYSTSSTAPTAGTAATVTSTSKTKAVAGLTPGATYYVWVRSVCDESNKSAWVALSGNTFTTMSMGPTVTVDCANEMTWTDVAGATSYSVKMCDGVTTAANYPLTTLANCNAFKPQILAGQHYGYYSGKFALGGSATDPLNSKSDDTYVGPFDVDGFIEFNLEDPIDLSISINDNKAARGFSYQISTDDGSTWSSPESLTTPTGNVTITRSINKIGTVRVRLSHNSGAGSWTYINNISYTSYSGCTVTNSVSKPYTPSSLTAGTTYYASVRANNSDWSDVVEFTAPAAAVSSVTADPAATSVTLTWPASAGATGYVVTVNGGDTEVSGTSATISGLTSSTSYTATVKAKTGSCLSDGTNVSFTTLASYTLTVNYKDKTGASISGPKFRVGSTTSAGTATSENMVVSGGAQTVSAIGTATYGFDHWELPDASRVSSADLDLTIASDVTLTAVFVAKECTDYTLSSDANVTNFNKTTADEGIWQSVSRNLAYGDSKGAKVEYSKEYVYTSKAFDDEVSSVSLTLGLKQKYVDSKEKNHEIQVIFKDGDGGTLGTETIVLNSATNSDVLDQTPAGKTIDIEAPAGTHVFVISHSSQDLGSSNYTMYMKSFSYCLKESVQKVGANITPKGTTEAIGVPVVVKMPPTIYYTNDGCSTKTTITAATASANSAALLGAIKLYALDANDVYQDVTSTYLTSPAFETGTGDSIVVTFSHSSSNFDYLTQYKVVVDDAKIVNAECDGILNNVQVFKTMAEPKAQITIAESCGGTIFENGITRQSLGSRKTEGTLEKTFYIKNTGTKTLNISSITRNHTAFTITEQSGSTVAPGACETFKVRYTSQSAFETLSSTVTVVSNDDFGNSTFEFTVIGATAGFVLPYTYESGCTNPSASTAGIVEDYDTSSDRRPEITGGDFIESLNIYSAIGGCAPNGNSAIEISDSDPLIINTGGGAGKAIGTITIGWTSTGIRKLRIVNDADIAYAESAGWENANECHELTATINDCTVKGGPGTGKATVEIVGLETGAKAYIHYIYITPCDPEKQSADCNLINVESANMVDGTFEVEGTDAFITVNDCSAGVPPTTFTPTTLTVSPGATITPKVGVTQTLNAQGFVTYVVTAADGITKKTYHLYPECPIEFTPGTCYADSVKVDYLMYAEDKTIFVNGIVSAKADGSIGCDMAVEPLSKGANYTIHYLSKEDKPTEGYKIEGPSQVCVGSVSTYRLSNAPESNNPVYKWTIKDKDDSGFSMVGDYSIENIGGTDYQVFTGSELKLKAPNVLGGSGDVKVTITIDLDFTDSKCEKLQGTATTSITATDKAPNPVAWIENGCATQNGRLELVAHQIPASGVKPAEFVDATKFEWSFETTPSGQKVTPVLSQDSTYVLSMGNNAPGITATVIASNGCGAADPYVAALTYSAANTTWTGAVSSDWNNASNWTKQVPSECTDVTIPMVGTTVDLPAGGTQPVNHYPVISTEGICDEITFLTGAGVKGLEHLSYRRAYVKATYQRDRWYTLTNPLKEMVSGDYYFGGVPLTYMRKFDALQTENGFTYTQKWTKEYTGLNVPLAAGEGFAYQVTARNRTLRYDEPTPTTGDQEVTFPRMTSDSSLVTELHKFNPLTGKPLSSSVNLTKTENAYRFAYDGASVSEGVKTPTESSFGSTISVPITAGAGKYSLIGNPMMCHLDLAEFHETNSSVIDDQFVFLNGETNESVVISTSGTVSAANPSSGVKLPPMQGFFVKNKGNGTSVTFNVADHFVEDNGTNQLRSADASSDGTLYVTGNDGKTTSYLSVRKMEGASNGYAEGEDAEKIFNAYAVSEISTLAGGVATDINHFSALPYETPLAVNTTADKDTVDLTFKGAESFENVNVTLVNKKTGEEINLKDENKYKFIFTKDEAETTLVLRFTSDEEITTDAEQAEVDASGCDVQIFTKGNNTIRVMSSSSNQIREVSIFDASGKLIAKEVATGNGVTVMDKVLNAGARNVVVTAVTDNCVKTEILQLR